MTPTSAAKVPTPHPPERRSRDGSPTACPRRRRRRARAHLASANATLAADLAAARADLALLRESAAAPTPSRPPPSFAVASVAADRIAAVDDERRALRAALDASRAECVALRRQLDTNAVTAAARRGDERAYPYDPAERDAAAVAAVARDRALSDLAAAAEADAASRRALAAKCSRSVSKALATCAAMETRLTEEHARRRRAERRRSGGGGVSRASPSVGVRDRRRVLAPRNAEPWDTRRRDGGGGDRHARGTRGGDGGDAGGGDDDSEKSSRKRGSSTGARRARRDVRRRRRPREEGTRVEEARVVDEVVDEAVSGVEKAYGALYEVIPRAVEETEERRTDAVS